MKKQILGTSLVILLLSFLAFQHIVVNMFVENVPFHTLEDKVDKEKESKETFVVLLVATASFYLSSSTYSIVFYELLSTFNYKDKHFRPPIV